MHDDSVLSVTPLAFPWQTPDPFLFCAYHDDAYPAGNAELGPAAALDGRALGMDFAGKDGWRMYHGEKVPGFPAHPHRGFETVTLVRRGLIDHSDSLGATARFGAGDVQWLTAGRGIVHCEMFPLVDRERPNPLELFQIWLNLPRADKMTDPHFSMIWNEQVPRHVARDAAGRETEITVVAGDVEATRAPAPPPRSWAARREAGVIIWTVRLAPGARWTFPAVAADVSRAIYNFRGGGMRVAGRDLPARHSAELAPGAIAVENGALESELLVLGGRAIGEPVVQHGPFVMTSRGEILQAFEDYQRTRFGGWPWPNEEPVHARDAGRFARRPDGSVERAGAPR